MQPIHYFLLCVLVPIAIVMAFFPSAETALAIGKCVERWDPECSDSNLFTGYWWRSDGFVPAMITQRTHFIPAPPHIKGQAVYYAKGVMEATARGIGYDLTDFVDGVAMMSPADIGQIVWIRRNNENWEGPFLVVDTSEFDDHWAIAVFRDEVVEVGFTTASRWGILDEWKTEVEVIKSRWRPPEDLGEAIDYSEWFLETARYYSAGTLGLPARYVFRLPGEWYIGEGRWISYLQWQTNSLYTEPWIRDIIRR